MKKIIYTISSVLFLLLSACSWENDPIEIKGDVSFQSYGLNSVNTISIYENDIIPVSIVRTSGLSKDIEFEISVDNALIAEYNELNEAEMTELPSQYYSFDNSRITFPKETKELKIDLNIKSAELVKNVGRDKIKNMIIPLKLTPIGDLESPETTLESLIRVAVDEPTITVNMSVEEDHFTFISGINVTRTLALSGVINFKPIDLSKLTFEFAQEGVDKYNEENETSYSLLPQSGVSIEDFTFDDEDNQVFGKLNLDCADLEPGFYLLPIKFASTNSDYVISQDDYIYIVIEVAEIILSVENAERNIWSNKIKENIPVKVLINGIINQDQILKFTNRPDLVDEYNTENGTSYKALDSQLTAIEDGVIEAGKLSNTVTLSLDLSTLPFEGYYKPATGGDAAIGTPPTEYLVVLQMNKDVLVEGSKLANEFVYIKLRKTLYGSYTVSTPSGGNDNYMKGNTRLNTKALTEDFPYCNSYYSWDHGYQWKVLWDENYNGDSTKKKVVAFSTVTSGFTAQQQLSNTHESDCYFDMVTGEVIFKFKYYWNESDKLEGKKQRIECKLINLKAAE